jgi:tight adherence protein C
VFLFVLICVGISAAFAILFVIELVPRGNPLIATRLAELEAIGRRAGEGPLEQRRRQAQAERLKSVVQAFGESVQERQGDLGPIRQRLIQAGHSRPSAVPIYLGLRLVLPAVFALATFLLLPILGRGAVFTLVGVVYMAAMGYLVPTVVVGRRIRLRQKEMRKALPDALDMLVVSVEAGLGLNQALVRVSEEIHRISPVLSEQLALVNLEIRAGTPREEALRNLSNRTGLDDISSLVAMLIQTDKFGTSVAQALRVHADTMRLKRRQRAEEAAAKTTIKLIFPLVFCVFPAMFVVILGPAVIEILKALKNF